MAELDARRRRSIVPPEGVPLELHVAQAGDRAAAFLFDAVLQIAMLLMVFLGMTFAGGFRASEGASTAIGILLFFCIRSFYFIWFETRWQGCTPGKRRAKIRVMDASGGPLRTDAIVARNLMREVEVWIPLALLLAAEEFWPEAPGWARLLFALWATALGAMPLFNRDRLRAGDMVAGTLVVDSPKAVLLPDLGGQEVLRTRRGEDRADSVYTFTDAQLDVYGIYELQVLEDLLRRNDQHRKKAFEAVAKQIAGKVDWSGPRVRPERFLRAFYAALRGRLERRMLLGSRKEDKNS